MRAVLPAWCAAGHGAKVVRMFGYTGKVAYIDLGNGETKCTSLPEDFAKAYIGANGFGARLLYDCSNPKVGALHPQSPLIFATGPFAGTIIPCTGRHGVFAKSPQTGTFGESYAGGKFGARMKQAGFDILFIHGKADKPSYLSIADGKVEVKSAKDLWGMGTFQTEDELKKVEGKDSSISSIGPAGEKLVPYACISNDFGRQAGRGGMGAVMGSKNLKAIAVSGTKDIAVKNPEKLEEYVDALLPKIKSSGTFKEDVNYGTGEFIKWASNVAGTLPTKNFSYGKFDNIKELDPYWWVQRYVEKPRACFSCVKPCGKYFVTKKGKFECKVEGPEYETLYALGSNCGNGSIESVAYSNYLCDKYGLDTISTGATIAFAMELFEKGIISEKDTGFKLMFGDEDAIPKCIELIARQEGFGKLLGLGVKRMAESIGEKAKKYAVEVKGLEPPGYEVRGMKGMALAYAVSTKGADHLRSCNYALDLTGHFSPLGLKKIDRFSPKGKARDVKLMEDLLCIYDSLLMCKFSRGFYTPAELANLLNWTTGSSFTPRSLMLAGERIYNLEKLFNVREGFTKENDRLPAKFSKPSPNGGSKGSKVTKKELEKMRVDYYKLRGWDKKGVPTGKKLGELGLKTIKAQQIVVM